MPSVKSVPSPEEPDTPAAPESTTPDPATNGHVDNQTSTAPPEELVYNPIKLSSMRTRSNALKGVWTDPSRVPIVTRPEDNTFVRVKAGDDYNEVLDLLVAKNASNSSDRNPVYFATDDVRPELERFIKPCRVAVGIYHHDNVQFLWVRSLSAGSNSWTDSVMRAMDKAQHDWISLESDQPHDEYKIHTSPRSDEWGEPKWLNQTFEEIVQLAFRDRVVDSLDHTVAKRLLGMD